MCLMLSKPQELWSFYGYVECYDFFQLIWQNLAFWLPL